MSDLQEILEPAEAAYREGDFSNVCNKCNVLLERLFKGLLRELKVFPSNAGSLAGLIDQFERDSLFSKLPIPRGKCAAYINWSLLRAVYRARISSAHDVSTPVTAEDAGNSLDVTRSLYRWFSPKNYHTVDQGFSGSTSVRDLDSCIAPLQVALQRCERLRTVQVKVLGLTLGQAWNHWRRTLLKKLDHSCRCQAEFSFLDPDWSDLEQIDPRWKIQADAAARSIEHEAPKLVDENPNISLRFWMYRIRPVIHGALINNEFLIASFLPYKVGEKAHGDHVLASEYEYVLVRSTTSVLSRYLLDFYQQAFAATTTGACWREYGHGVPSRVLASDVRAGEAPEKARG